MRRKLGINSLKVSCTKHVLKWNLKTSFNENPPLNARGVDNFDTRLVLKSYCQKHKPDLFIYEAMISRAHFSPQDFRELGLKFLC